jgi:dTDP-4-amino-4,6-dideoxygalactose transaminase
MHIPFLSFARMNADVKPNIMQSFETFFDDQWYILGKRVIQFEQAYAQFNSTKHCVGVANGLDALILALKALNIGNDDEVIVPANTYIASWLAISYVGATPIAVEPKTDTWNINPELIEEKITPKTKAIMPVHLYGQCCEMEHILQIATSHNLFVIEDNAQAQGAAFNGKLTGSFGHINATSFYPGKNLGAYGDAGAITTDSNELAAKVSVLRNYGSQKKYYNEVMGINSRLDEVQAGFLDIKLSFLNQWNEVRNHIATQYAEQLADIETIQLPNIAPNATSVFHLFVIKHPQRNKLQDFLLNKGIGTMIHYPIPPHLQQAYAHLKGKKGDYPITEEIAERCLSLPIYPGLTESNVTYICDTIKQFTNA